MDSSLAAADHREVCTISKYQEFDAQIFEATKIMIGFTLSEGQKAELLKIAGEICSSPFYFALFLPLILAQHAAFSTRLSAARGLQRTTFSRIDKRKIRNHGFRPCKP